MDFFEHYADPTLFRENVEDILQMKGVLHNISEDGRENLVKLTVAFSFLQVFHKSKPMVHRFKEVMKEHKMKNISHELSKVKIWNHGRLNMFYANSLWHRFNTKLANLMTLVDNNFEAFKVNKRSLNFVLLLERLKLPFKENISDYE